MIKYVQFELCDAWLLYCVLHCLGEALMTKHKYEYAIHVHTRNEFS